MASGGAKAIKELEKEQKTRGTRMVRDYLDRALLDLATLYRDVLLVKSGTNESLINLDLKNEVIEMANSLNISKVLFNIQSILKSRINLANNASPILTVESLMCRLIK
jgi:DNA polymerase-3 subunit delta'